MYHWNASYSTWRAPRARQEDAMVDAMVDAKRFRTSNP